jgi:hypothetical protein
MRFGFIKNFISESKKWGTVGAFKIYFDHFLHYAELNDRPLLKPLQSFLAKVVFEIQIHKATPVFVFQMGKVGSTSIYLNLVRFYPGAVVHSHNFLEDHKRYQTRRLYRWAVTDKKPIQIVSLVREPISRNISALFQNYQRDLGIPFHEDNVDYEKLEQVLLKQYHLGQTRWFERRIEAIFGMDVYATPFPASGHDSYAKDNVRLLILRLELPNGEKERVIKEFLGIKRFEIINANVGAEKDYADQYRKFKTAVRLPPDYVDTICNSKFARHFYAAEEIEKARVAWKRAAN